MHGVIVFAHGSRDPLWRAPVEAVAREIGQHDGRVLATCAYLELCEPDMATAVARQAAAGVQRIRVLPLFFGMGKHAREDLPRLVEDMAGAHPSIRFELMAAAGEDPRLTALLARIALEDPA
jgi:sirohydrochlorin cobaltochelatase